VTEGLETIEEIGIRGKSTFLESGGERFVRIPCVEDHPGFVEALAEAAA
jgi:ferrochelatase